MFKKHFVRASVATSAPGNSQIEEINAQKWEKFRIGVLGASGYTGSEVAFLFFFLCFISIDFKLVISGTLLRITMFSNCIKHVFALL